MFSERTSVHAVKGTSFGDGLPCGVSHVTRMCVECSCPVQLIHTGGMFVSGMRDRYRSGPVLPVCAERGEVHIVRVSGVGFARGAGICSTSGACAGLRTLLLYPWLLFLGTLLPGLGRGGRARGGGAGDVSRAATSTCCVSDSTGDGGEGGLFFLNTESKFRKDWRIGDRALSFLSASTPPRMLKLSRRTERRFGVCEAADGLSSASKRPMSSFVVPRRFSCGAPPLWRGGDTKYEPGACAGILPSSLGVFPRNADCEGATVDGE